MNLNGFDFFVKGLNSQIHKYVQFVQSLWFLPLRGGLFSFGASSLFGWQKTYTLWVITLRVERNSFSTSICMRITLRVGRHFYFASHYSLGVKKLVPYASLLFGWETTSTLRVITLRVEKNRYSDHDWYFISRIVLLASEGLYCFSSWDGSARTRWGIVAHQPYSKHWTHNCTATTRRRSRCTRLAWPDCMYLF